MRAASTINSESQWTRYPAFRSEDPVRVQDQGGDILISVDTSDRDQRNLAAEIFEKAGSEDIRTMGEATP